MFKRLSLCLCVLLPGGAMAQDSNAARYLVSEQLNAACPDGGAFRGDGPIERDLTGDGRDDLIIDHGTIACDGATVTSGFCGARLCSVMIYVRKGALLELVSETLSGGVTVDDGDPPVISGFAGDGSRWSLRWTGERFE
jgi:hypothetical protein